MGATTVGQTEWGSAAVVKGPQGGQPHMSHEEAQKERTLTHLSTTVEGFDSTKLNAQEKDDIVSFEKQLKLGGLDAKQEDSFKQLLMKGGAKEAAVDSHLKENEGGLAAKIDGFDPARLSDQEKNRILESEESLKYGVLSGTGLDQFKQLLIKGGATDSAADSYIAENNGINSLFDLARPVSPDRI